MVDAKNILAVAISIAILAFVIENIPTLGNNIENVFGGISLSSITTGAKNGASFPVSLDVGLLTSSFSLNVENVENITAKSEDASMIFDDRQISINPLLVEDMSVESYSGKLTYDAGTKNIGFDGAGKGFVSNSATLRSERNVKINGNLSSSTTKLTNVAGGSISVKKASGKLIYNSTNSLSLLGEDVKITGFSGEMSIGSFGIVLNGNANRVEVNGNGKSISYG